MESSIIDDDYNFDTLCNCEVCHRRIIGFHKKIADNLMKNKIEESKLSKWKKMGGTEISFINLLKYLVPSKQNRIGVPIMIPETVVFDLGKIRDLYCFSKDHSQLRCVKNPDNPLKVIKVIISAQKQRFWPTKRDRIFPIVIVWLTSGYKLLTESEFIKHMMERPKNKKWNNVQYLQSYILDKHGVSSLVNFDYEAPYSGHTSHSFDIYADPKIGSIDEYPKRICSILGYYLYRNCNINLISMKATFTKDNLDNLWLSSAKDIYIKANSENNKNGPVYFDITQSNDGKQGNLGAQRKCLKNYELSKVNELSEVMDNNYKAMKLISGITVKNATSEDEFHLDKTFDMIRPGLPYKLSEMLNLNFNPKESLQKRLKEGKEISTTSQKLAEVASPAEIVSAYMYMPIERENKLRSRSGMGRTTMRLNKLSLSHEINNPGVFLPKIIKKTYEDGMRYKTTKQARNFRFPKAFLNTNSTMMKN